MRKERRKKIRGNEGRSKLDLALIKRKAFRLPQGKRAMGEFDR